MVVYRAKNVRIVSMSQYLWTWLYILWITYGVGSTQKYKLGLKGYPCVLEKDAKERQKATPRGPDQVSTRDELGELKTNICIISQLQIRLKK